MPHNLCGNYSVIRQLRKPVGILKHRVFPEGTRVETIREGTFFVQHGCHAQWQETWEQGKVTRSLRSGFDHGTKVWLLVTVLETATKPFFEMTLDYSSGLKYLEEHPLKYGDSGKVVEFAGR